MLVCCPLKTTLEWKRQLATEGGKVRRKVLAEDWAEHQSKSSPSRATVILKVLLLYW